MMRNSYNYKESKFSPILSCENMTKVNHFNNEVIIKTEDGDHAECNNDLLANTVKSKTEDSTEDNIVHEDVKPEICEEKSTYFRFDVFVKSENESYPNSVADISIGTEDGPNSSHELSKDFFTNSPQKFLNTTHESLKNCPKSLCVKFMMMPVLILPAKLEVTSFHFTRSLKCFLRPHPTCLFRIFFRKCFKCPIFVCNLLNIISGL